MTIDRTAWIWPSAMSSAITLATRPSVVRAIAPGRPLTVVGVSVKPPNRSVTCFHLREQAHGPLAAEDRPRERRGLAAAVAVELDVGGQELLQRLHVAVLDGAEEPGGQLLLLLAGDVVAGPLLVDPGPRAHPELAGRRLAAPDDLGDLAEGVVEDVVEQEDGALLGRELLEQDEEGERERVSELGCACGSAAPNGSCSSVRTGSGSHSPT